MQTNITPRQRVVLTIALLVASVVLYLVGKDAPAACLMGVAMGQFGPAGIGVAGSIAARVRSTPPPPP